MTVSEGLSLADIDRHPRNHLIDLRGLSRDSCDSLVCSQERCCQPFAPGLLHAFYYGIVGLLSFKGKLF